MRVHKHYAREPGDPVSALGDKVRWQPRAAMKTERVIQR